ncbi:hypothetical protein AB1Y20_021718 [Prymnesium parvum]|uniref:tRNA-intron lyase n=1 Tax=Prymnesium parvum TaxID=97485 RepID=A0AB34JJ25_PRYPA
MRKVRIYASRDRFLVWEAREIHLLRFQHRLVGSLAGGRQAADGGPPLALQFEEALLALEEGFAHVLDAHPPPADEHRPAEEDVPSSAGEGGRAWAEEGGFRAIHTTNERMARRALPALSPAQLRSLCTARLGHARVFRELWGRGLYISPGQAFGADYLCYPGDPIHYHAHALVHVHRTGQRLRPLELIAAARMAGSVKKTAVIAELDASGVAPVRFLSLTPCVGGPSALVGASVGAGRAGRYARRKRTCGESSDPT